MPAVLSSPTPSPLYAVPGKNYAPSVPLKELAQNKRNLSPNPLSEALQEKFQTYMQQDYGLRTEKWNIGQQIANLREGKNLLLRNVRSGKMMTISKQDGRFSDYKTVSGQFQFYSTKLLSEWLSSNPELDPICPSSDDQIEEFIAAVKIVQDYYDKKLFDVDYRTLECLSAQDYGTWITRYRYDEDIDDIVAELLDFPSCVWDWRKRAEESPYFIYQSKISTAELAFKYDAEINSDGESDGEYSGLRYVEMIAKQGGNTVGNGKDNPYGQWNNVQDENIVTEMWLQPEAYCDIELPIAEKTVSGDTIPKGSLMELFPNGLCVTGINGMNTILQLSAENHKDHIVSGLYHVQSFCGVGKGLSDMVDAVKELNDLHSQLLAHTKAHSMPAFAYDSNAITEAQARKTAHPRGMIAVDFSQAPDGATNVNQLIQAIVPGNAANAAFQMREYLKQDVQIAAQSTDFSAGLPGVNNKTATGARLGDAAAASVLIPQHLNLANFRKRSAIVIYKLFRKFKNNPHFFATKNINGITKGRTFNNDVFEKYVDIDFEIVNNSQISESPFQQKENLANLFQYTGGMPGLFQALQMNPDLTSAVISAFGVKLPIPMRENVAKVCRRRIENCRKLLEVELFKIKMLGAIGVPVDTTDIAISIVDQMKEPISPQEMYAPQKCSWMAELLDTDEFTYGPFEMRLVVEELIRRQLQVTTFGQGERDMDTNLGQVMGMLPQVLGEQAMGQQAEAMKAEYDQQQQQAQAQGQQMQAMAQGAAQIQAQSAQAKIDAQQSDAAHQQALAQSAQQHAIATEQQNQSHAQEQALQMADHEHQAQQNAIGHLAQIEAAKRTQANKPKAVK